MGRALPERTEKREFSKAGTALFPCRFFYNRKANREPARIREKYQQAVWYLKIGSYQSSNQEN